ncbi:MAG: tripartite tricarboxylate transporter TctB family protein [Hyphomicrobiaceae bacterium]
MLVAVSRATSIEQTKMTIWGERIAAALCSVAALYMAYVAWEFPAGGNQFPLFACASILAIACLMIVRSLFWPGVFTGKFQSTVSFEAAKPLLLTAAVIVYVLLIFRLGYYTSSLLFLLLVSFAVGVRSLKVISLTALVTLPLMYAFFELFLQAQMPRGVLV